jgi:plasmid stabilization system protein ParE
MDWQVVWTETAVADLEQIVRNAVSRSPTSAESLRVELLESVEVLARFPLIGPATSGTEPAEHERFSAGATAFSTG